MKTNELQNIKETGFKVPKDYFENLEESVVSHLKLKEATGEFSFKTPTDYFGTIENSILSKITNKKKPPVISIFSRRSLIYASSIAAAVLLLFSLSFFENKSEWENIEADTVENYIINENIGAYELAALLIDEDEINTIELEFAEEAIENYILEHATIEDLIKTKK